MYNGPVAKGRDSMRGLLKRLDPVLRDEYLRDKVREERASHIVEDNGKFKVTVDTENKEFSSFEEADQEVDKFFRKFPLESNFTDLEQ